MKNKIGIVTFHNADNYGAMLQTFALYSILNKYCKVYIVNYNNRSISNNYRLIRKPNGNIIISILKFVSDIFHMRRRIAKKYNFSKFRNNLNLTYRICKINELSKMNFDCIISGSDQVWNPNLTAGVDDFYFLNFNKNKFKTKKISYAASCGDTSELVKYENEVLNLINDFDYVSVREKSFETYLNSKSINVTQVLDPTLLLSKNDWISSISKKRLIKEKYIFVYSVGNVSDDFYKKVNDASLLTGYKIVYFSEKKYKKYKFKSKNCFTAGPSEFLNLLYNCEFVITTSFHGLALSSILNKKMCVIYHKRSSRLESLINILGLNNNVVSDSNSIENIISSNVDWDKVNSNLEIERNKSVDWLLNAINILEEK